MASSFTFEAAELEELERIPWLNGPNGRGMATVFGRAQDAEQAILKDAVSMRNPLEAPADALVYLGRDRSIFRAPIQNDEEYALTLDGAQGYWDVGGTKAAIVNIFRPYGHDETTCHVLNDFETSYPGGPWFSRVLLLLDFLHWNDDGLWDDPGAYDDNGLWDSDMSQGDADYIRRSIRALKAPESYPVTIGIPVTAGDGFWDSPGFYDDGGDWDDPVSTVVYLTIGHVWEEEIWTGGDDGLWDSPGDYTGFEPPNGGW